MIEYQTGDLLTASSGHIVHGCNARGVMGAGVALAIKNTWPEVYNDYRQRYQDTGLHLGQVLPVAVGQDLMVWNAITQQNYGNSRRRYVSYDAIAECFEKINDQIAAMPSIQQLIPIPKIGAGLAGGDWAVIATIIDSVVDYPVTVWVI
jgi:O-acetyl-ADP-ribose deacetylase (regulator of RNase III)